MSTADRYIRVEEIEPAKASKRWAVRNIRSGEVCGIIKWYGGFRGYAFFPTDGFLFDASCLLAIASHLNLQNGMRRAQKTKLSATQLRRSGKGFGESTTMLV